MGQVAPASHGNEVGEYKPLNIYIRPDMLPHGLPARKRERSPNADLTFIDPVPTGQFMKYQYLIPDQALFRDRDVFEIDHIPAGSITGRPSSVNRPFRWILVSTDPGH